MSYKEIDKTIDKIVAKALKDQRRKLYAAISCRCFDSKTSLPWISLQRLREMLLEEPKNESR